MKENTSHQVWMWKEPDSRWLNEVKTYIKCSSSTGSETVVLHCDQIDDFNDSIPLSFFILRICRKFHVLKNRRTMFMNLEDLFEAIELSLNKMQKEKGADGTSTDNDIVDCHKLYVKQFESDGIQQKQEINRLNDFLNESNCADLWKLNSLLKAEKSVNNEISQYLSKFNYLILGPPQSTVLKQCIGLLSETDLVQNLLVETSLDVSLQGSPTLSPGGPTSNANVSSEVLKLEDVCCNPPNDAILGSATEEYAEQVIISFLNLLVNNRTELALSKVMISPIIDLSHDAFSKLKHTAAEKEMPLCQTAISFITRVQLGGKGYAPSSDCPLHPHFKSLELFVNVLNQMQTVLEEDLKPSSAVKRLINILKKKLLKCGSDKLKPAAVEKAAENINKIASKVAQLSKSEIHTPTPIVQQESLNVLYDLVNYFNCCFYATEPKQILERRCLKRTPINLPPLMGYFRTPEEDSSESESVVSEDSMSKMLTVPQQPLSYFHHSDSSSMTCVDNHTPSKTSFKDCFKSEENKENINPRKSLGVSKGRKRSILNEITNEIPTKFKNVETLKEKKTSKESSNSLVKKKKQVTVTENKLKKQPVVKTETKAKQKGVRSFKQIEGQGKITSFFLKG